MSKWISTAERNPDKDGRYLVVVGYAKGPSYTVAEYKKGGTRFCPNDPWATMSHVRAWMPIPKYEEECEDE